MAASDQLFSSVLFLNLQLLDLVYLQRERECQSQCRYQRTEKNVFSSRNRTISYTQMMCVWNPVRPHSTGLMGTSVLISDVMSVGRFDNICSLHAFPTE